VPTPKITDEFELLAIGQEVKSVCGPKRGILRLLTGGKTDAQPPPAEHKGRRRPQRPPARCVGPKTRGIGYNPRRGSRSRNRLQAERAAPSGFQRRTGGSHPPTRCRPVETCAPRTLRARASETPRSSGDTRARKPNEAAHAHARDGQRRRAFAARGSSALEPLRNPGSA
jgi:hypothetical protein